MTNKKSAGFFLSIASVIISIIALISYSVLARDGEKSPSSVYLITSMSILLQALTVFVIAPRGKYNKSSAISSILLMAGFITMMMGRIEWLGGLAAHNASLTPMHPSFFVTIVIFVLGVITSITSAFMEQYKK